jgi:hypothetical protein
MYKQLAAHLLVATTVVLALGAGCGSTGAGCSTFVSLPKDSSGNPSPAPLGIPQNQVIEGGVQARITKPGMDKLLATIPSLLGPTLNGICLPGKNYPIGVTCFDASFNYCMTNGCAGNTPGCAVHVELDKPNEGITATLSDGDNPVIHVDAKLNIDVPLEIGYEVDAICIDISNNSCVLDTSTPGYNGGDGSTLEFTADLQTGIDPTTGELTLHLKGVNVLSFSLAFNGCGALGSTLETLVSGLGKDLLPIISNLIVQLITPQLDALVQSFLPKPLGLAGVMNTGSLLASFNPPSDANVEMFIVPGGYVAGSSGGLTLGVMSGANSDRDETTRTPDLVSEPALCVPARAVPDIGGAPWNLPPQPLRNDFTLQAAGPFAGMPDPTDGNGMLQDVAIGLSRTYLNLLGFHFYSSGTLCLDVDGAAIPQLNAGTISLLIQSLGNIVEDKKSPLQLVLRPQTPIVFTIGAGTMADPLIHIGITDMRIDFYAWIEERWARVLTMAVDIPIGLNLTVTKDANGNAAIEPMLIGVDAKNVTIRVSNTDLLNETPDSLAKVFPSLINVVAGALTGVLGKPITLPSVAGFSLTDFSISRVQTTQDDFVGIFANLTTGTPSPIIDWGNPAAPLAVGNVRAKASVANLVVPSPERMRALFEKDPILQVQGQRPTVQLNLASDGDAGRAVEWAWRIDNGLYHSWSTDAHPVISDDALLLQGHHAIAVRARAVGDWTSEDPTPATLDVVIDSVAPELHPARDAGGAKKIALNGFDLVTATNKLRYAWRDAGGNRTAWSATSELDASTLSDISRGFNDRVVVYALDEAGNIGEAAFDAGAMLGETPKPLATGCAMAPGGSSDARGLGLVLLALMALVIHRRRSAVAKISARASLVAAVAAAGVFIAGCGCQSHAQCSVDDDCAKMQCGDGKIPSCAANMCSCVLDQPLGDIGRFSSMAVIDSTSYVSAYNNTYGDLMIGHIEPPGIVANWDFVDGVPDVAPELPGSHVRGGVQDPGDDVGRYTSIGSTKSGDPIIAYYDKTHGSLKFASFGVIRWHTHEIDKGSLTMGMGPGDDLGRWASMTVDSDGKPAIAYSAWVQKGMSGMPESQLRWAQANTATPTSSSDWTITVLDSRPTTATSSTDGGVVMDMAMAAGDGGVDGGMSTPATPVDELLPPGIALMSAAARNQMDLPAVVYYDYDRGNLRYVAFDPNMGKWTVPAILDGEDSTGKDLGDFGRYPTLIFDMNGTGHIAYESTSGAISQLCYMNTMAKMRELVDDGFSDSDEMTQDGIPSPVWHSVGDSASVQLKANGQPVIAYQDSTVLELRLATRQMDATWQKQYIAGHAMPFKGSYGFYANLKMSGSDGVLSTYAINQQPENPLYYVEIFALDFGSIE